MSFLYATLLCKKCPTQGQCMAVLHRSHLNLCGAGHFR
jgi:hypothetical protein